MKLLTAIDDNIAAGLYLDESRLRQILVNIVGNAVKFTEEGQVKITARQTPRFTDDTSLVDLIISVEDTGIGIPDSELKTIFEAFKQQAGHDMRSLVSI